MEITDAVKVILEQIKETVRSETIIGSPVQAEDSVIIPVSKVSFGFAAGGGTGSKDSDDDKGSGGGMGTGGGATVEPVAFVVVSKGKAQLLPLKSREATLSRLIDLIPSLIDLAKNVTSKKPEKKKENNLNSEKETNNEK